MGTVKMSVATGIQGKQRCDRSKKTVFFVRIHTTTGKKEISRGISAVLRVLLSRVTRVLFQACHALHAVTRATSIDFRAAQPVPSSTRFMGRPLYKDLLTQPNREGLFPVKQPFRRTTERNHSERTLVGITRDESGVAASYRTTRDPGIHSEEQR